MNRVVKPKDVKRKEREQQNRDDRACITLFSCRPIDPFQFRHGIIDEIFGTGGRRGAHRLTHRNARRTRWTREGLPALIDDRLGAIYRTNNILRVAVIGAATGFPGCGFNDGHFLLGSLSHTQMKREKTLRRVS